MRRTLNDGLAALLVLVALGSTVAVAPASAAATPEPSSHATFTSLVHAVGGASAGASDPRYGYLWKLDSHLQAVAASELGSGSAQAGAVHGAVVETEAQQGVDAAPDGDVSVDVYVTGDVSAAASELRALGMHVLATSDREPQRMVEGQLPPAALAAAARIGTVQALLSSLAQAASGSVQSQGDGALNGPAARLLGATGTGVSVGIVSTSINQLGSGIAGSQATGDLPASVHDLLDDPGEKDEGRAMAEIVYDEAPGITQIDFATGMFGAASKASSIDSLVAAGDKVIADDIYFVDEPFFQDDVIAQAVDRAKAAGVAYFALAGNEGNHAWQGSYTPVADPTGQSASTEDFDPGPGVDTLESLGTVPANGHAFVTLEWAEPWAHASSDFAIDFYDLENGIPTIFSTEDSNNVVSGLPIEWGGVHSNGSAFPLWIGIRRNAGTATPILKFIDYTDGAYPVTIEHPNDAGAIDVDAGSARGALTVAATQYQTPAIPEVFSSRGPVRHYFDANGNPLITPEVLQKPDMAAPDGVTTTVPGFTNFHGTSAAAPAAAGIAALIRSAKPAMGVDELYAIMTNPANALSCGSGPNPNTDCGIGFTLADRALAMAQDPTPPAISATVTPPTPDGANGWYRGPVTVSFAPTDNESPLVDLAGCDTATPGDGQVSFGCSATSAGGTTSTPAITLKRDSTPPSTPAISGIAAQAYPDTALPDATGIGCSASDPTSGVASCSVSAFDPSFGSHTLTATATNGAGLSSTSTLTYSVFHLDVPPLPVRFSITSLALAKGAKIAALTKSGIPFSLRVGSPSTRLTISFVAQVAKKSGRGTRLIQLGTLSRNVDEGLVQLKLALSSKAKQQLKGFKKYTIKVTIASQSAVSGLKGSLHGAIAVKR